MNSLMLLIPNEMKSEREKEKEREKKERDRIIKPYSRSIVSAIFWSDKISSDNVNPPVLRLISEFSF
jgi:hypothetical protein